MTSFDVALPGIITAGELAEKRDGFKITGIRFETPGLDMSGFDLDDEDGRTIFEFASQTEASMFKLKWG